MRETRVILKRLENIFNSSIWTATVLQFDRQVDCEQVQDFFGRDWRKTMMWIHRVYSIVWPFLYHMWVFFEISLYLTSRRELNPHVPRQGERTTRVLLNKFEHEMFARADQYFLVYSSGISISPSSMEDWISRGDSPLTVHPTELQVPRISLTVPANFRAMDRSRISLAISMTWSRVKFPLCLTCLTFFRSRTGSFNARMTREEADGIIETVAWRLTTVNLTVTFKPFQSMVAFWISSPTFLGDKPRGPILGARDEAEPISPPYRLACSDIC